MEPFSQIEIGNTVLSNRLIMAPLKTAFGKPDGMVNERHIAFYQRRAEGKIAAIIIEPLVIDPACREHPKQLSIMTDDHVEGLSNLTSAIHQAGSLAVAHFNHGGRAVRSKASGMTPEAPSTVTCPSTGETPEVLSIERINTIIEKFARATGRAVNAGFDIIELQFGLGYLISQFISSHTNHRNDEYGGSLDNRYRFGREVLAAVQDTVGNHIPIIARISANEMIEGGITLRDAVNLAQFLEEQGIAALHVVSGSACDSPPWYFQYMSLPAGKNLEWAGAIRKSVNIPVFVAGRMGDPADIRHAINEGIVDGISLGRPLLADPDLPLKMKENRDIEVAQCGACLQGCFARVHSGEGIGCLINPEAGFETEAVEPAVKPAKVVIIGGGPAGIQAAVTADKRGHNVILFDEGKLGGQFRSAVIPPGKTMMKKPLDGLINKIKHSSVTLKLNQHATAEDILWEKPDHVILSTGSIPIIPEIKGMGKVLFSDDVLFEKEKIGQNALIIGGGMVGLETADFLAQKGHKVTVVEMLEEVGRDMIPINKKMTMKSLTSKDVTILTNTKVEWFDGDKAFIKGKKGKSLLGEFDTVIIAIGMKSQNRLKSQLLTRGISVHSIGDANKPANIFSAVRDGFELACRI
ncbi:MAG: FAD-dependent oxidoreductase [Candidatus Hatepunaea meridiana]|nr:FAD-dependent oxidoreductase [Candidatus Hatepunaea meridiana]